MSSNGEEELLGASAFASSDVLLMTFYFLSFAHTSPSSQPPFQLETTRVGASSPSFGSCAEAPPAGAPRMVAIVGWPGQARPIPQGGTLPRPPPLAPATGKITPAGPRISRASSSRHTFALATSPAPSAPARAAAAHVKSKRGLRARAIGGANGGSPRCRQEGHDHLAGRDVGHDRPPATARARENVHQINSQ